MSWVDEEEAQEGNGFCWKGHSKEVAALLGMMVAEAKDPLEVLQVGE